MCVNNISVFMRNMYVIDALCIGCKNKYIDLTYDHHQSTKVNEQHQYSINVTSQFNSTEMIQESKRSTAECDWER